MATTADALGILGRQHDEPAITTATGGLQNKSKPTHLTEENMPPARRHEPDADFDIREAVSQQSLTNRRILQLLEAQAVMAQTAPKANGNSQRATIIAALLISFVPQAFSVVWWTRGTERDTASRVETLEKTVTSLTNTVDTMKTWNERVRLNLADNGWLVDPISGEVNRKKGK